LKLRLAILSVWLTTMATFALAQTGAPISPDSPLYKSFTLLKSQPAYRMTINMQSNDPRMAQAAAMGLGFSPIEKLVQGDTSQVIMHMKMPAMDIPGKIDDWEIRAVAKGGRAARMFSSPAIPRLKKMQEQQFAMQMAMLDRQAGMAIAQALALGPFGAIRAGMLAGETAAFIVLAARQFKKAEEFWDWKCMDQSNKSADQTAERSPDPMSDMKATGDEAIGGTPASGYDFYVRENGNAQGPVHLAVAKDSGLPLRIGMTDPQGHGSMQMDYAYTASEKIEIPECLAKAQ